MSETSKQATALNYIQQPGLDGPAFYLALSNSLELEIELAAGVPILSALEAALKSKGLAGAYLHITNAETSQLEYVIPALAPDDTHVAWYSNTYQLTQPGRIVSAGFICGTHKGDFFTHCHGLWSDASGNTTMGHLLPDSSILSHTAKATGFGFTDASFERSSDQQTGFDLFLPTQLAALPAPDQAILMRVSPNHEIGQVLGEIFEKTGWTHASIHGVGSLISPQFSDDRSMASFATEVLITEGTIKLDGKHPLVSMEVAAVGLDGAYMQGQLSAYVNPVLITFEIILVNQSEKE